MKARYKAGELLAMSCGQPGVPRVSPLGLKHFSHKAGADCGLHEGVETAEHLELKNVLAEAEKAAGWESVI